MSRSNVQVVLAAAALAVFPLAGCASQAAPDGSAGGSAGGPAGGSAGGSVPSGSPSATTSPAISGEIVVFAAASLTESFTKIGKDFEAAHPGVKVTFNFAGSSALAQQINQGAPADVFASAAPANVKQVGDNGGVTGQAVTFARNRLEIAVPKGNPAKVSGLADLDKPDNKIALCAEQVPCGAAARRVFEAAGITPAPDTLEQDVKAVLTKVRLGEVDAGLVYRTDVLAAGGHVTGIDFPEADKAVNDYPIAALAKARNAAGARAFVDYVLSERGRSVLAAAGFDGP